MDEDYVPPSINETNIVSRYMQLSRPDAVWSIQKLNAANFACMTDVPMFKIDVRVAPRIIPPGGMLMFPPSSSVNVISPVSAAELRELYRWSKQVHHPAMWGVFADYVGDNMVAEETWTRVKARLLISAIGDYPDEIDGHHEIMNEMFDAISMHTGREYVYTTEVWESFSLIRQVITLLGLSYESLYLMPSPTRIKFSPTDLGCIGRNKIDRALVPMINDPFFVDLQKSCEVDVIRRNNGTANAKVLPLVPVTYHHIRTDNLYGDYKLVRPALLSALVAYMRMPMPRLSNANRPRKHFEEGWDLVQQITAAISLNCGARLRYVIELPSTIFLADIGGDFVWIKDHKTEVCSYFQIGNQTDCKIAVRFTGSAYEVVVYDPMPDWEVENGCMSLFDFPMFIIKHTAPIEVSKNSEDYGVVVYGDEEEGIRVLAPCSIQDIIACYRRRMQELHETTGAETNIYSLLYAVMTEFMRKYRNPSWNFQAFFVSDMVSRMRDGRGGKLAAKFYAERFMPTTNGNNVFRVASMNSEGNPRYNVSSMHVWSVDAHYGKAVSRETLKDLMDMRIPLDESDSTYRTNENDPATYGMIKHDVFAYTPLMGHLGMSSLKDAVLMEESIQLQNKYDSTSPLDCHYMLVMQRPRYIEPNPRVTTLREIVKQNVLESGMALWEAGRVTN